MSSKFLYGLAFVLVVNCICKAQKILQVDVNGKNSFEQLAQSHANGQMHDTIFMLKTDSVATHLINMGKYFTVNQMTENLVRFEEVAWKKPDYGKYRQMYYLMLLNNVYMADLWGASMYYAEKLTIISQESQNPRPLIELTVKMYIYSANNRYEEIINTYESHHDYFKNLFQKVKDTSNCNYVEAVDALKPLGMAFNAYAAQRDTANVEKMYREITSMIRNIENVPKSSESDQVFVEFTLLSVDYFRKAFYEDFTQALDVLHAIKVLKNKHPQLPLSYIDYSYLEWKTSLFMEMKQRDSVAFYLNIYEQLPNFSQNQKFLIYKYKAELALLDGDSEKAYDLMTKAFEESIKVSNEIATEIDELLYAHTEAEHQHQAVLKSKREKKAQNLITAFVIGFASLAIVFVYILFRLKAIRLKKVVDNLAETANKQIALMEQLGLKVRKDEQRRISQELHDNLAGTLVAIKNNIDIALSETSDQNQQNGLRKVSRMVESTFDYVRNKSHEMFEHSQMIDEEMFCQHILGLAQVAFPSSQYTLNVQIDDYALQDTSIELKTDLIRIIQEAFSNIIKHANASRIDLLIYKEENNLFIIIQDNGIGLVEKSNPKKMTFGLQSIQKRLNKYKADFSFNTSLSGAEMIICIDKAIIAPNKTNL